MFFRDFLFRHAPKPGKLFDRYSNNFLTCLYYDWWRNCEERVTEWHRKRLKELDINFAASEDANALIEAREQARAAGIGPGDPRYPDLWDIKGCEPPVSLSHRLEKLAAREKLAASS